VEKFSIKHRSRKPAALIASQETGPAAKIMSLSAAAPTVNQAISVRAVTARARAAQIVTVTSMIEKPP
jgi:hypothetical protein